HKTSWPGWVGAAAAAWLLAVGCQGGDQTPGSASATATATTTTSGDETTSGSTADTTTEGPTSGPTTTTTTTGHQQMCGDGVVEGGEECDDGNKSNYDACISTCVIATCGDGIVRAGYEECD